MTDSAYFAYGADLNAADWAAWCHGNGVSPDCIQSLGIGFLPDADLRGGGGALDLVPRLGQVVIGTLFAVAPEGWAALDARAGAPHRSARHRCTVIRPDGSCTQAVTYRGLPEAAHGLDAAMLEQAPSGVAREPAVPGIFVYGTLLQGEERGHVMARAGLAAIRPATITGRLLDLGDYPGLVLDLSGGRVEGEWVVPTNLGALLAELDVIEEARPAGAPGGLYRRTLVTPKLQDPTSAEDQAPFAWTYVISATPPGRHPWISGGSWRRHRASRRP